jgi:hypothetical protein
MSREPRDNGLIAGAADRAPWLRLGLGQTLQPIGKPMSECA